MNNDKRRRAKGPRLPEVLNNWQVLDDAKDSVDNERVLDGEVISSTLKSAGVRTTQRPAPTVEQRDASVVVQFARRQLHATPGSAATTSATVLNNGPDPLTFDVLFALAPHAEVADASANDAIADGPSVAWLQAVPDQLHLQPGQRAEVALTAAPPRTASLLAGDYPLALTVTARDERARHTTLAATLTVEPFVDLALALSPPRLRVRWQPATRRPLAPVDAPAVAALTNRGNRALPVRVQVAAPPTQRVQLAPTATVSGALHAAQHQFDLVVRPGETRRIPLHVAAAGPRLLRPLRQPLRLTAFTRANPTATPLATPVANPITNPAANLPAANLVDEDDAPAEPIVLAEARGVTLQRPLLGPWSLAALATFSATLFVALAVAAAVAMVTAPLARQAPAPASASTPLPPQVIAVVLEMEANGAPGDVSAVMRAASDAEADTEADVEANADTAINVAPDIPQAAPTPTALVVVIDPPSSSPAAASANTQAVDPSAAAPPANPPGADPPAADPPVADLPVVDAASGLPIVQPSQITGPGELAASESAGSESMVSEPVVSESAGSEELAVIGGQPAESSEPSPATNSPAAEGEMTYAQMFQAVGLRYDLDWRMLAAQAFVESSFEPNALGASGDMGLMQVLPDTWAAWAPVVNVDNPFDSYSNVLVAAAYLDSLRTELSALGYSDARWMLAAYNGGPTIAQTAAQSGDWSALDPVVQRYAEDVLRVARTIP